ncbi:MAG: hypothetical protein IPM13_03685 [Phycisphaerales bacterium]|nr:hypothetical protein [Phycisphaerales bacterium]
MSALLLSPFFVVFAVIALGSLLGALHVRGVSLGPAGVFFVALVAGHFLAGFDFRLPHEITELGLVLFVYAVGLTAGPRFFAALRRSGAAFMVVGLSATLVGALVAVVLAVLVGLSAELAAGMYCGATTCTPALAATLDAIRRTVGAPTEANPAVASALVAYGAAYPFSVACVVLTIQLLPRLMRTSAAAAAERFRAEEAAKSPPIDQCAFRISNPGLAGRTVEEIQALRVSTAVVCRIRQGGAVQAVRPETVLHVGDVVLAVGTPAELAKLEALFGEVVVDQLSDAGGNVTSEQLLVSRRSVVGKTLRELAIWERFGVVVTRVRREGVELTPRGNHRLEPGDVLRVVGPPQRILELSNEIGREERRLNETSWVPFAAGVALGAAVGLMPLPFPAGVDLRLGLGGGAFLVALLLGHAGTIGPVRLYVPNAAKHFARELGLVLFLAGAGLGAGQQFVQVFQAAGGSLLLAGAAVTLATVAAAGAVMFLALRWNVLFGAGALSACMTNPPGLVAATNLADSDAASVGFASVYPVALISKIVYAPLVYLLVQGLAETAGA